MLSLTRMLFREPDGRRKGLLFGLCSVGCLLAWVYAGVMLDGLHHFLFLGVAFGCSGVAESLPPDRRRSAGALRLAGLGVLAGLVVLLLLAPGAVLG
jgi:hypothetical protein